MKSKHPLIILSFLGIVFTFGYIMYSDAPLPASMPSAEPISSPYADYIAASGITEANTRNIEIGTTVSGVISEVMVDSGGLVKKDDPLFKIDDWDIVEKIKIKTRQYNVIKGQKKEAELALMESRRMLGNAVELESKKVISKDEMLSKTYNVKLSEAKLLTMDNQLQFAEAELASLNSQLDKHTVRSPVDGNILQVNIKKGEYTQAGISTRPIMVVGNTNPMYIRVDIDEYKAWRFNPSDEATAVLKDNANFKIPLTFIRKEPLIIPKTSLGGNLNEKIDTRVFQVIYSFDPTNIPVYIGQQMDVYIKSAENNKQE